MFSEDPSLALFQLGFGGGEKIERFISGLEYLISTSLSPKL